MQPKKPGASNKGEVLTDIMLAEIREIFSLFDKDSDGYVSTSELGTIVRGLNFNPSVTEVEEMIRDVDPEGRGLFNQNALCSLIARRPKQEFTVEELMDALNIIGNQDTEDSNTMKPTLLTDDFSHAMITTGIDKGENLTKSQVEEIINDSGLIYENKIIIEDFAYYLKGAR